MAGRMAQHDRWPNKGEYSPLGSVHRKSFADAALLKDRHDPSDLATGRIRPINELMA
jgi:hypothetical protein